MPGRSVRLGWLALTASVLLHVGLLGGLSGQWPQWQAPPDSPPIEARLVRVPPVPAAKPLAAPMRPAPARPVESVPEPAAVAVPPEVPLVAEASGAFTAPPAVVSSAESAAVSSSLAEVSPEAVLPPLNALPSRLDMRFQVDYGWARGEQTLLWVSEGNRYTVTSVAAASGIAGLFYSGRFVQTSRGGITPHGLMPEEFWDQRGDKRSSARFDAHNGNLTLHPAKGAPRHFAYDGVPQDALSLFFHLSLTAPPAGSVLAYTVFNGKKLRYYVYDVRGEAVLETGLGALRTLHLARRTDGDGRFEIWLAIDRHYLPVRVLRSDDKGNEVELKLLSMQP